MADAMYRHVAQELRERIESGEIASGDQLPTELELRDQYGASRNTIRDAIKWLAAHGLVETRTGQGTFALRLIRPFVTTLTVNKETGLSGVEGESAFAEIRRRRRCPSASVPRVEVGRALPDLASLLGIPAGSQVITRRQERHVDGIPWCLQTTAYPLELAERGADGLLVARDIAEGAVAYVKQALDVAQIGCRDKAVFRPANEEEARFFASPDEGIALVVCEVIRIGYRAGDAGPVPLRATFTVFPADRVQFVIDSGDVPRDGTPPAGNEPTGSRSAANDAPRPAGQALHQTGAAPAGQVARALACPVGRPSRQRARPVLLADGAGDGEEGAEQDAEGDSRTDGERDENSDEAGHDGLPAFRTAARRGSPMCTG
jgi:GntR family transcriptional regulator